MSCSIACSGDVCVSKYLWDVTGGFAHLFGGALWVLGLVVLCRPCVHPYRVMAVTWIIGLVYVLTKEFWYDENHETTDERGSAWFDSGMYIAGFVLGTLLSLTQLPAHYNDGVLIPHRHSYTRTAVEVVDNTK